MELDKLDQQLGSRATRRRVIKTGAKIAYAAPLVAVSFKLTADGALARSCPQGFTFDPNGPPNNGPTCCKCTGECSTVVGSGTYNPATNQCEQFDPNTGKIAVCDPPTCDPQIVIASLELG